MSLWWVASQIQSACSSQTPASPRYNPRPPGVIRDGSATMAVLTVLREHPTRIFRHADLTEATGKSKVAVDWALIYLHSKGLIDRFSDQSRNSRYLRYRLKPQPETSPERATP